MPPSSLRPLLLAALILGPTPARATGSAAAPHALAEGRPELRRAAERSRADGGVPALSAAQAPLAHHDYRVRRRAARALLRAGDPGSVPLIAQELLRPAPEADVRAALAWTAVRLGIPEAAGILRAELHSSYWHRRLNAVADLAALQDAGAAPWLRLALRDELWLVRLRALRGLVALDPRPHVDALLDCQGDDEEVLRREALTAIVALGRPEAPELLDGAVLRALQDDEPSVRRVAARALGEGVASARALGPALAFSLRHDRDDEVRAWLARALLHDVDEETSALARDALGDAAFAVRAAAAGVLGVRGEAVPVEELARALASAPRPEAVAGWLSGLPPRAVLTRLGALAARGGAGPAARALAATASLGDGWRTLVDAQAAEWLLRGDGAAAAAGAAVTAVLGRTTLVEALLARLGWLGRGHDPRAPGKAVFLPAAASALGVLAPRLSVGLRGRAAVLLDALSEGAPGLSVTVLRLLEAGAAPEALARLAHSPRASVRAASVRAAAALGLLGLARAALEDPVPPVRLAAARALSAEALPVAGEATASLGPPPAAAPRPPLTPDLAAALRACLRDESAEVREAAAQALWRHGEHAGLDEWRSRLGRRVAEGEGPRTLEAAGLLAGLVERGDAAAARLLLPVLASRTAALRTTAREALRRLPSAAPLLEAASARGRPLVAVAAAHLLAERGHRGGPAAALAPLARLDAAEAERLGEVSPIRLARALAARVSAPARTPHLTRYLERVVAPDLLARWAEALAAQTPTRWRGTAPYNMRRQHLYDREVAEAVRLFPGLHPRVLKALLFQESNFEALAGNGFDCVGLAAFCRRAAAEEGLALSDSFRDFAGDGRYAPRAAIRAAVRHLRRKARLLEEGPFAAHGVPTGRDYWAFVLAAYNGGHEQVAAAMDEAFEQGLALARALGQEGEAATRAARAHATRWENLLAPEEAPEESPLYRMTRRRYSWYRPYGRYAKMSGAEAKYHEIGQFPLDILDRAFEDPRAAPAPHPPSAPIEKGVTP